MAGAITVLLCWSLGAFATDFALTGWSGQLWGEYTSPYFTNNPSVGNVACDDFLDTSYVGITYTYKQTSATSIIQGSQNGLWGQGSNYEVGAYLALQIFQSSGNMLRQEYYNWALWSYFDPTDALAAMNKNGVDSVGCNAIFGNGAYSGGKCTYGTGGLIGDAMGKAGAAYASGAFNNLVLYTPQVQGGNQFCGQAGHCQSQEFFGQVPDGGSQLAYLGLAALACVGAACYSRRNAFLEQTR